jgi:hypothetical protein
MFQLTSLIICSLGIGVGALALREWVRNGFDLVPKGFTPKWDDLEEVDEQLYVCEDCGYSFPIEETYKLKRGYICVHCVF